MALYAQSYGGLKQDVGLIKVDSLGSHTPRSGLHSPTRVSRVLYFSCANGLDEAWGAEFYAKTIYIDILYLVSIAVKDYEVTRLLHEKGYVGNQVAYSKYLLEPSKEELQAWNLAQADRRARLLVLVSPLKTACCAAPLIAS